MQIKIFKESFPDLKLIKEGVIYLRQDLGFCIYKCPCKCKREIVLPLNRKNGWAANFENEELTLSPSILMSDSCKSHYFIKKIK